MRLSAPTLLYLSMYNVYELLTFTPPQFHLFFKSTHHERAGRNKVLPPCIEATLVSHKDKTSISDELLMASVSNDIKMFVFDNLRVFKVALII